MYEFYLDKTLFPVPPSKMQLTIKNQNKTINLLNGDEINIIKTSGLTELSFDVLLPQVYYPFAVYEDGFVSADYYTELIKKLKVNQKPFRFLCIRESKRGDSFFDTNMLVTIEDYKISEDVSYGNDLMLSISLKQYVEYGTKQIVLVKIPEKPIPVADPPKEERPANPPSVPRTHTVGKGDSLWSIAKKYWGKGSRWPEIYNANRDKIKNPNLIYDGQVLTIP